MQILVTGGTGFLGSVLVRQLLETGAEVAVLRRASSRLDLLGDAQTHVRHCIGDLTDVESLHAAMQGVTQVYHTAAYVGFGGPGDAEKLKRINVTGTANVVNAAVAQGVKRLVHTSSIAALGRPEVPPPMMDEQAIWAPSRVNTPYAESKYQSELEVHRGIAEGLDAVIVNPAMIFGPGRTDENTGEVVEKVRTGKMPVRPAGGTCVVDVEDVAAGLHRAMTYGQTGERYILGGDNLMWSDLLNTIAEAVGVQPPRFTLPPLVAVLGGTVAQALSTLTRKPPALTPTTARLASRVYRYSNQKAVEQLGCSFRPFTATTRRIAAHYSG